MNKSSNPTSLIRDANRSTILRLLASHGPLLRNDLCRLTGLTGAAVSRIARELIDSGLLIETAGQQVEGQLGRRSSPISINGEGAAVVAVTISANRRSVALFDAVGKQIKAENLEHLNFGEPAKALRAISKSVLRLTSSLPQNYSQLSGIGVGMAAPADDFISDKGVVNSDGMGWSRVPVGQILQESTGLPVKVETRASAILRAELPSIVAKGFSRPFLVNIGVGVGTACWFDDGFQWSGNSGFGRLSHITHPSSDSACSCGRTGCLEQAATGAAVVRKLFSIDDHEKLSFSEMGPNLAQAAERADEGDCDARDAFFEAGRKMALGVDVAFAMLNPDLIMIAGETGRQTDFAKGVSRGLRELHSPVGKEQLQISKALSAEGSASIALDAFVYSGAQPTVPKAA